MNRVPYTALALIPGLVTAHLIAWAQVYASNSRLYQSLAALGDAGYLIVPNHHVMATLPLASTAFMGALFFTLSTGAGLSFITLAAVLVWDRLLRRRPVTLAPFGLFWVACIVMANLGGLSPFATAHFVLVPAVTAWAALRLMPPPPAKPWVFRAVHMAPMVGLICLWSAHADRHLFSTIRDTVLLSSSMGERVNTFYYAYNLYAAEVFKSAAQRMLKTCTLDFIGNDSLRGKVSDALRRYDYLTVDSAGPDLTVRERNGSLAFEHLGRRVLTAAPSRFLARPGQVLTGFSEQTDRHRFFRQCTFVSLLVGFPFLLYLLLYSAARFATSFFTGPAASAACSSCVCLAAGILLFAVFFLGGSRPVAPGDVPRAAGSARWQERVMALRTVADRGMEIGTLTGYRNMLHSPHVPERYWAARALGTSRLPGTYHDMEEMLHDPHPNVVTMAIYSLGRRGRTGSIDTILALIASSDHWYVQWYAYRALKALGWTQPAST